MSQSGIDAKMHEAFALREVVAQLRQPGRDLDAVADDLIDLGRSGWARELRKAAALCRRISEQITLEVGAD